MSNLFPNIILTIDYSGLYLFVDIYAKGLKGSLDAIPSKLHLILTKLLQWLLVA